jgi:hypothetical protein
MFLLRLQPPYGNRLLQLFTHRAVLGPCALWVLRLRLGVVFYAGLLLFHHNIPDIAD